MGLAALMMTGARLIPWTHEWTRDDWATAWSASLFRDHSAFIFCLFFFTAVYRYDLMMSAGGVSGVTFGIWDTETIQMESDTCVRIWNLSNSRGTAYPFMKADQSLLLDNS